MMNIPNGPKSEVEILMAFGVASTARVCFDVQVFTLPTSGHLRHAPGFGKREFHQK